MITIKTILFFFAIAMSITALGEFVEKLLCHLKRSEDDYHQAYTRGLISTTHFWSTFLATVFWTAIYLINQITQ